MDDPVKFGATPKAIEYVRSTRTLKEDITGFIYEHKYELDSIDIVLDDDELKRRIIEELYRVDDDIYITSSVKQLIEISYKDAGKKSGVKLLSERLGIARENIAAFGDADNDCDMIEYAGAGIAMGNACESLKAAADYVTLSNDEDGLAYAFYNILGIGYFVDENQRKASQSTSYFEFQKGHYTTCWCENSINICTWVWDEYEMSGLIRQVIKDFDYYGITEVTKKQWNRLVELSKATSAKAEPILMEAASWAEECFKENEVFTIIGM